MSNNSVEWKNAQVMAVKKQPGGNPPYRVPHQANDVPLFPVRYALGDNASKTPNVDGSLKVDHISTGVAGAGPGDRGRSASPFRVMDLDGQGQDPGPAMPLPPDTHYTLRRLRQGYLHVFSEKGQSWRIFETFSDHEGMRLIYTYREPEEESGANGVNATGPGLLIVPGEDILWLAFSDATWTERIMDLIQKLSPKDRAAHMRKFDPKNWQGPHAAPLSEAPKWLADTALGIRDPAKAFKFSADVFRRFPIEPQNVNRYTEQEFNAEIAKKLMATVESPHPMAPGVLLALEDPAGITMDLATLMESRSNDWMDLPDPNCKGRTTRWALMSCGAIDQLKGAVSEQEHEMVFERKRIEVNQEYHKDFDMVAFKHFMKIKMPAVLAATEEEAQRASENAWKPYTSRYREDERTTWFTKHHERCKTFHDGTLDAIAKVHVAWCESRRLLEYFNCIDEQNVNVGIVFTSVVTRCYAGVATKKACLDHMVKWLSAPGSKANILVRAQALGQIKIEEMLRQAIPHHSHPLVEADVWKHSVASYYQHIEENLKITKAVIKQTAKGQLKGVDFTMKYGDAETVLSQFINATLSAPLGIVANQSLKGKKTFDGLVAAGVACRAPYVPIRTRGDVETFLQDLIQKTIRWTSDSHTKGLTEEQITSMAQEIVDRLKRQGHFENIADVERTFMINLPVLETEAKNLTKAGNAAAAVSFAKSKGLSAVVLTSEQMREWNLAVWKNAKVRVGQIGKPLLLRSFLGILQVVDCNAAYNDMEKAGVKGKTLAAFLGSGFQLVGTIGESIEKALSHISGGGLKFGQELEIVQSGGKWVGRIGVVIGGLLIAYVDGIKMMEQLKNDHLGWAVVYGFSALAGFASVALAIAGWVFTGSEWGAAHLSLIGFTTVTEAASFLLNCTIVLLVITLTINIILAFIPNPIESWLDKCCWCKELKDDSDKRYKTMEEERNPLRELGLEVFATSY